MVKMDDGTAPMILAKKEIKGYTVKMMLYNESGNVSCVVVEIYYGANLINYDKRSIRSNESPEKGIARLFKEAEENLFTEEELLSPCPTLEEFKRRVDFLTKYYGKRVKSPQVTAAIWKSGYLADGYIISPIGGFVTYKMNQSFVNHHIELYKKLQKTIRPTIFPIISRSAPISEKFQLYAACLPFAEPDDPGLEEAKRYLHKNAKEVALKAYEVGNRDLATIAVKTGGVNRPTLQKLLDDANNKADAIFAAVLLDVMKGEEGPSPRRFAL